jgi:electron transport complex protein RnfG
MSIQGDFRSGATLGIIAAVCTAIVALTWQLTHERIADNRRAWLEQSLAPVMSELTWDNDIIASRFTMSPPHGLPGSEPAIVYRAFDHGKPVAALFVVTARDGYSGPIRLLIGAGHDGRLTGVRILEHRETPGLGDGIESGKSGWIEQFPGRSLVDPAPSGWKIRRDGGEFDQLTGASVTPRAVIKAVFETLQYFVANRDAVFAAPADVAREEAGND